MADHVAVVKTSSVSTDALVRAWRTFYVAIGMDILLLVGAGLTELMGSGVEVTSQAFWAAAGVLMLKSVLTGVASFLLRLKVTPKNERDLAPVSTTPDTGYGEELGVRGLESEGRHL